MDTNELDRFEKAHTEMITQVLFMPIWAAIMVASAQEATKQKHLTVDERVKFSKSVVLRNLEKAKVRNPWAVDVIDRCAKSIANLEIDNESEDQT